MQVVKIIRQIDKQQLLNTRHPWALAKNSESKHLSYIDFKI